MISKEELLSKITPKNDLVFKKIFGSKGNEGILKSFLESILDIEIESLVVDLGIELLPDFYDGKLSRLDVKAKLNDRTIVNIEVQTNMSGYSDSRSFAYWSKLYLEQYRSGDDYKHADKTICIWILDGEVYDFPEYHSQWNVTEKINGKTEYFEEFEIHVIELKKFRKENIMKPKNKEFWLWFIDHTKREMVEMSYSLEEIRKAKAEYEKMLEGNESLQHLLSREELAEWDRRDMMQRAKEEGKKKEKLETAKKMLEKGMDIETIIEITDLTKEEIEKLR